MAPTEYLGAWGTLIHEKNLKSKISCQTPFNVPLFKKLQDIIFLWDNNFMSHFEGHFEGAKTFLTPEIVPRVSIVT